jgi:hypothetical protein
MYLRRIRERLPKRYLQSSTLVWRILILVEVLAKKEMSAPTQHRKWQHSFNEPCKWRLHPQRPALVEPPDWNRHEEQAEEGQQRAGPLEAQSFIHLTLQRIVSQ